MFNYHRAKLGQESVTMITFSTVMTALHTGLSNELNYALRVLSSGYHCCLKEIPRYSEKR
jgi:hypothetical protein